MDGGDPAKDDLAGVDEAPGCACSFGGAKHEDHRLLRYDELPEYMKDNEFILNYYRSEWPISKALLSLFSLHNETLNVWTHLLGFLLFVALTVVHLGDGAHRVAVFFRHVSWPVSAAAATKNASSSAGAIVVKLLSTSEALSADSGHAAAPVAAAQAGGAARWPFFVFLCGSMFCLLCSSLCHLLCCHSHRLNIFLNRLDYVGIAVMIVTSFFPPIYYVFQCHPLWQLVYLSAISAAGIATVVSLLSPHLIKGKYRGYRAMLFVGMGLSAIVPAAHAVVINWAEPRRNVTMAYEACMATAYLTGTAFYVTRVPERWRPGWFDLAGHSHQIFHVFVVVGALAHYGAAVVLLQFRDAIGC